MLDIFYCESCKAKICACGEISFAIFECICEQYCKNGILEISTCKHDQMQDYLEIIRYLELKGFVVTTESGVNLLQVKPCGLDYGEECETFIFCLEHKD